VNYWRLWEEFWVLLYLGNPVCAVAAVLALVFPPYRIRYVASWPLPLAVLIAAAAATAIAATYFPDA
jgi:hypothetical protein